MQIKQCTLRLSAIAFITKLNGVWASQEQKDNRILWQQVGDGKQSNALVSFLCSGFRMARQMQVVLSVQADVSECLQSWFARFPAIHAHPEWMFAALTNILINSEALLVSNPCLYDQVWLAGFNLWEQAHKIVILAASAWPEPCHAGRTHALDCAAAVKSARQLCAWP